LASGPIPEDFGASYPLLGLLVSPKWYVYPRLRTTGIGQLLASCEEGLQHALDRLSVACDQVGMKISTKKTEVLCLFKNPSQCTLQVSSNTQQQVKKFKYGGVVFASDGRQDKKIDKRVCKPNACSSA